MQSGTFTIHDAVGNWIFFRLMNPPKELVGVTTGIFDPKGWIKAKLRGVDNVGIWLENPHFKITYLVDSKGNPLLRHEQKETTETVAVLIRWEFIASVIRADSEETEENKPAMGFPHLGQRPVTQGSKKKA